LRSSRHSRLRGYSACACWGCAQQPRSRGPGHTLAVPDDMAVREGW